MVGQPVGECLCPKLLPQFLRHLNDISLVYLISCDKAGVGGMKVTISDSSSSSHLQSYPIREDGGGGVKLNFHLYV